MDSKDPRSLADVTDELALHDAAMAATSCGISISDARRLTGRSFTSTKRFTK